MMLLALIVLITGVGAAYEMSGRAQAARDFPPPGKLVDIGGRKIQLDCRGTGSPTVVFESWLGIDGSSSWTNVHDAIAKTTRACAYSRAGIMWSDPTDVHQSGKSISEDLHATLNNAGESSPYVLVGHSIGGPYIMTYTKYFGNEVAGLVFVDASHPEQEQRLNAAVTTEPNLIQLKMKIGATLSWTGVVRAFTSTDEKVPNMPDHVDQATKAYAPTSLEGMVKENDALSESLAEAGTIRSLGDRPVIVLTAAKPLDEKSLAELNITAEQNLQFQKTWEQLQDEEASWSSQSQHWIIHDAGHCIQCDRPDMVIAAVRSVVEKVRSRSQVGVGKF